MSIFDAIKNSVLENFDTTLSIGDMISGLGAALLAGLFILLIYRTTMRQVSFNRSFCLSLLLVCGISAMMVLTITSNLALSLGMVGALSIVRFRTAIKDASDTAFLFWSVAAGITAGAGFLMLTLVGCLAVGIICLISTVLFSYMDKPFLLVIRCEKAETADKVERALKSGGMRFKLSSLVENDVYAEIIYELAFSPKKRKSIASLKEIPGVTNVSLVDCQKG